MDPFVLEIIPHTHHENTDLFRRPSQGTGKQRQTHRFTTPGEILVGPHAELLVPWIPWPSIDGPFDWLSYDIDIPSLFHHLRYVGDGVERESSCFRRPVHIVMPFDQVRVLWQRTVVASDDEVDVVDLQVAVCLQKPGNVVRRWEWYTASAL